MEIDVTQTVDKPENACNKDEPGPVYELLSEPKDSAQSKKCIKHALRQQAKRRRKNTTIASGNTAAVPRIIVKPLPPQSLDVDVDLNADDSSPQKTPTMKEVLASIPGFNMKPRKRSSKKLSTAAQLEQTKEGCIDLETPDSILVNTNLRGLLNKYTFAALPPLYQQKLVQLLPSVDRQVITNSADTSIRLSTSGLNNEFFARACLDWQERLTEGEFTPENQQRLKSEADKERSRLDPWKLKHFEPIWGDRSGTESETCQTQRPPIKTTIKLRPAVSSSNNNNNNTKAKPPPPPMIKRLRTVGAVTRSCTNYKEEDKEELASVTSRTQIPDLLPIAKTHKAKNVGKKEEELLGEKRPLEAAAPVNVSDIIQTNEETIISIKDPAPLAAEKRRRSQSSDADLRSPKRKTPSPSPNLSPVMVVPETQIPQDNVALELENEPEQERQPEQQIELELELEQEHEQELEIQIQIEKEQVQQEEEEQEQEQELEEETSKPEMIQLCDSESNSTESLDSEMKRTETTEDEATPDEHMEDDTYELESTINKDDLKPADDSKIEESETFSDNITEESEDAKSVGADTCNSAETENYNSASTEYDSTDADKVEKMDAEKIDADDKMDSIASETEYSHVPELQILPSGLILRQEASAEKLRATVEESDLVISQITETNFERVKGVSDEDEANEDRFLDAETYVLESGQISVAAKGEKEDMQTALFATTVSRTDDCCWDMVSSTEKLLEVPFNALDSVPVGMVGSESATEHVEVIPMQEELEVRLEEGTFPVPTDWPYGVKMDSDMVAAALGSTEPGTEPNLSEFSGNQVKLELEVTLTPEIVSSASDSLVTSSSAVGGIVSSSGSSATVTPATVTTVIPPTTIVCLPSVVSTAMLTPVARAAGGVQSSSALPYLALSTSQPMRAVPAPVSGKGKAKTTQAAAGGRSRGGNKPPPGAVNLERSYQICQAVIQNSPNRDQLRCQLKPPPALLAAAGKKERPTQYGAVTSSRTTGKPFTPPLPAAGAFAALPGGNGVKVKARVPYPQQRQPSPPVVVRHVFTSGQGIPVTMAVLPQAQALSPEVVEGQSQMSHVGQYILVQRAGVGDATSVPRSSSAPPAHHQAGTISTASTHLVARGRPASVDPEQPQTHQLQQQQQQCGEFVVQCPNPGTQAVTRRPRAHHGAVYGDVSVDGPPQNYTVIGDHAHALPDHPGAAVSAQMGPRKLSDSACPCSLKAMVVCRKCGAFCHDDCIGPNKICRTCFIR